MAITVDTDTYISLADCETYLDQNHTSAEMATWEALSPSDCEVYLRKACKVIDNQPYLGYKKVTTQTLAFPRVMYTESTTQDTLSTNLIYGSEWYVQTDVPDAVKYAQCEIAITLASGVSSRVQLQREGVKSYSIGHLSETFSGKTLSIVSHEARELLAPYLAGSVRVV